MIIPKLKLKFGENLGAELFIYPPDLDGNYTFLNNDYASGVASFSVDNGLKLNNTEYIVIGEGEKAELLLINGVPTATTIVTASASSFAHSRGEKVQFIPYNQIEIYKSVDGGLTYNLLTTVGIGVASETTYYNEVDGLSTYYYKVRFKNSTTSKYSEYSDAIIATGYTENSVGNVIRRALIQLGESVDTEVLTKEFLYEALNEGRREIDEHVGIIRWPFRTEFDYDAGNVIPGQNKLTLPTNLRYPSTNENILAVRIGSRVPLDYVDKHTLNTFYESVGHTTLNGAVLTGDPTITLTSSGDFEESGSIQIAAQAVDETIDEIDYTANDESTNVLSGVTGIRAAGHATAVDVWQNGNFGLPICYTVNNGIATFNCPFDDDYAGENIWLDYYKTITDVNSDADLLDEPFYNIYIPWMKWKIKSKKDSSLKAEEDSDYKDWKSKQEQQVIKNYAGQNITINIDIP